MNELRFAWRMLVKTPAFSLIAILAIALGIGISTTMFSSVNALLLRPMPLIQNQDRLVYVSHYFVKRPEQDAIAFPDYLEYKKAKTLEGLAVYEELTVIVSDGEKPARYLGAQISADAFSFLGVQPILGRRFRPEEDAVGAPPVALLGYDLWQKQFAGEPTIVGRVVPINGRQTTVVGVMPKGWRFPEVSDIWLPLQMDEKQHPRGEFSLDGVATVRKGVSIAQARAELEAIAARLATQYPQTNSGSTARVRPLREEMTRNFKALTLLVLGAVLFVHLIACANVANLLLARGATRAKEIGVRIALGASRSQIVRQLLTESVVLSAAGCALGLVFAVWGVDLMLTGVPSEIPYWIHFDFDWRVFAFALGLGAVSSIIVGLMPALQASRPHLLEVLKDGGRSGGGGSARSQRVRNALVVSEVA
ncbi:MAG TPA: ABC transporter permease, partial [Chthoniobacterales bacterium]|nr:ABC transporter permease [Chthoniobacterales bacterium]